MLDDLEDLGWTLRKNYQPMYQGKAIIDGMYCPECGGQRRMNVEIKYQAVGSGNTKFSPLPTTPQASSRH